MIFDIISKITKDRDLKRQLEKKGKGKRVSKHSLIFEDQLLTVKGDRDENLTIGKTTRSVNLKYQFIDHDDKRHYSSNPETYESVNLVNFFGKEVYCHILIDVIPKLIELNDSPEYDLILTGYSKPTIEILKELGIKLNKIKFIKKNFNFYLKSKKVTLEVNYNASGRTKKKTQVLKDIITEYVRSNFKGNRVRRLIYCTRNRPGKGAKHARKMVDICERKIMNRLKKFAQENSLIFTDFTGWEDWRKRKRMTFKDQMLLFSEAEVVVGPHGGAMVNIMGMLPEKNGKVCEFTSGSQVAIQSGIGNFGKNYNRLLAFCPKDFVDYYLIPFTQESTVEEASIDLKNLLTFLELCNKS